MAKQDPLKAIRAGVAAAKQLTETEQTLRKRHGEFRKERQLVATADPAMVEVLRSMETLVDSTSKNWAESFARGIVRSVGGHEKQRASGDTRMIRARHELPRFGGSRLQLTLEDLCGLVPQLVKERLAEIIRQSPSRFGLAAEPRAAKLAELDKAISATVSSHTGLVDGAAEVGITLPLLEPVARERKREQERQAREAELEDARLKRAEAAALGENVAPPAYVTGVSVGGPA